MPSPVEALPCGSRSTISTVSPTAASAVPRLMAVVVLPTPPFWLASARMRGTDDCGSNFSARDTMGLLDHEDHAAGIGHARVLFNLHFPRFGGIGQFRIHILSLVKIANGAAFKERFGIIDELGQGRKGPGGDRLGLDLRRHGSGSLDPEAVYLGPGPRLTGRLPQEGAFLQVAFEEMSFDGPGNGEHQTRNAGAAAEVGEHLRVLWHQPQQLQGIRYVAGPDVFAGRRTDQVDALLPEEEQTDIGLETVS